MEMLKKVVIVLAIAGSGVVEAAQSSVVPYERVNDYDDDISLGGVSRAQSEQEKTSTVDSLDDMPQSAVNGEKCSLNSVDLLKGFVEMPFETPSEFLYPIRYSHSIDEVVRREANAHAKRLYVDVYYLNEKMKYSNTHINALIHDSYSQKLLSKNSEFCSQMQTELSAALVLTQALNLLFNERTRIIIGTQIIEEKLKKLTAIHDKIVTMFVEMIQKEGVVFRGGIIAVNNATQALLQDSMEIILPKRPTGQFYPTTVHKGRLGVSAYSQPVWDGTYPTNIYNGFDFLYARNREMEAINKDINILIKDRYNQELLRKNPVVWFQVKFELDNALAVVNLLKRSFNDPMQIDKKGIEKMLLNLRNVFNEIITIFDTAKRETGHFEDAHDFYDKAILDNALKVAAIKNIAQRLKDCTVASDKVKGYSVDVINQVKNINDSIAASLISTNNMNFLCNHIEYRLQLKKMVERAFAVNTEINVLLVTGKNVLHQRSSANKAAIERAIVKLRNVQSLILDLFREMNHYQKTVIEESYFGGQEPYWSDPTSA